MRVRRKLWGLGLLASGVVVDAVLGVSTASPQTLASLGMFQPGYCDYEPSPWSALVLALGGDVPRGSVLLDLGSGKGRGVLAAARLPFRRVIGVEHAPQLHALAQENLRRFRGPRRCDDVVLVCADVAERPIADEVTHLLLNNPVVAEARERLFAQLAATRRRRPRAMRVIYLYAEDPAFETAFPDAQLLRRRRGVAVYDLP
ncbi:MAG: hypothetical protein JWM73_1384 [Solirubrobacterales bacterium]|nr:hypothetical protein [Solirubrobacterales bacterium]